MAETKQPERRGRMLALAALPPKAAGKALGKRGLAEGRVVADWQSIVGPEIAMHSLPEKLAFPAGRREAGTLHLLAAGAWALDLQHSEPQVIERINGYFGYRAVARLRIRQGSMPRPEASEPPAPLTGEATARIESAVQGVADEGLRRALSGFGQAVLADDRSRGTTSRKK